MAIFICGLIKIVRNVYGCTVMRADTYERLNIFVLWDAI